MNPAARVLAVGWDAADGRLVREMVAAGELPHLGRLASSGSWGILRTPPGLGDDGVWASFSTCRSPGRHGRYFWMPLENGEYDRSGYADDDPARRPFWVDLSVHGRRVGIIDVPKTPLAAPADGLQLSDWLVHGRDGPTRSSPPDVAIRILERYGDDRTDRSGTDDFLCSAIVDDWRPDDFTDRLLAGLQHKRRAVAELLSQGGWDLFLAVFKESHCAGHAFWNHVDPLHPDRPDSARAGSGEPVRDVYRRLDAALGELVATSGSGANVIVFSDLGMRSNYTAEHLLDRALLRLERFVPHWAADAYPAVLEIEDRLRNRFSALADRSVVRRMRSAYQVQHNELAGAIRVNVQGRERFGRVRPGRHLDRYCGWLEDALMEIEDPAHDEPVVERIIRSDEMYAGERRGNLPDLLVVWNRSRPITSLYSQRIGEVRAADPGWRPGNHVEDGWYVMSGPSVPAAGEQSPASIMDIGPTVAELVGTDLPDVDGVSLLAGPRAG